MDFTLEEKNMTPLSLELKGTDPQIADIQDEKFTDVVKEDGTELKDVTFESVQEQNVVTPKT